VVYQRAKGRDLFDLWLLTTEVGLDSNLVCDVFSAYRPPRYTGKKAIENLEEKLQNPGFISDTNSLISEKMNSYSPNEAAEIIIREYLVNV